MLALNPSPLLLTDEEPADSITVSGDTLGVSYTPAADADCTTSQGSIAIAGDGQTQLDQASVPLMFLAYAVGTPPADCMVTVRGSDGSSGSIDVSYEVVVLQTQGSRLAALAVAQGVTPASVSITKANQVVTLTTSGFSGRMTAKVESGCTSGSGIQVTPSNAAANSELVVVPFGQGAISKSCTIDITDPSGDHTAVPVTLAIPALRKFTMTPSLVQFGCAGATQPTPCQTVQSVALSEGGAQAFSIVTRPGYKASCANAFEGPLKMTTGDGAYTQSVLGPTASVAFNGLLPGTSLGCSTIIVTDNGDPAQRLTAQVDQTIGPPSTIASATAPPCVGADARVAIPNAPHGMFVWNPYVVDGGIYESQLESSVIGKDPTLCGVSLVVQWADLEPQKGVFDFSEIDGPNGLAAPYANARLTVNLLFSAGPERGAKNPVTPAWVTDPSGDDVPVVKCTDQPPAPDYMDPTFEQDWHDFITAAVQHFSYNNSTLAPKIGYMRFAIGFGVEAIPAHFDNGEHADCLPIWTSQVGFSYDGWVQHAKNVVRFLSDQNTDKQLLVALNELDGGPSFYDYPNQVTEDAANHGVGFGTENLGISNVALPTSKPAACDPQAKIVNLYWCQAFTRHVGVVPFEFQTIVASTAPMPGVSPIDLGKALEYGLDNNTQIFELYPQEWMAADVDGFVSAADQTAHQQALHDASLVVGAAH
ncbi:MAG TPA: hypothetical protein VIJ12_10000 [Candidatus Baltobacteraceae bacterium]